MTISVVRAETLSILRVSYPANEYLGEHETSLVVSLIAMVSPRTVIEFGTNKGMTANVILRSVPSIETYIGIDAPAGHQTALGCQQSEVPDKPGQFAAHDPRFFLYRVDSNQLTAQDLEPADAIFIDGDHSREGALHDSMIAAELLRAPGIIVWHDYTNPAVGVTEAVNHLSDYQGWPINHIEGTWLAYCQRG